MSSQTIKLWSAATGACVRTYSRHTESVACVAWLPCGRGFVSASADRSVMLWGVGGEVLHTWHGARVTDLAVSADGVRLVAASESGVRVGSIEGSFEGSSEAGGAAGGIAGGRHGGMPGGGGRLSLAIPGEPTIGEVDGITALCLSCDASHCLVSVPSGCIHLWHLDSRAQLHEYRGHRSQRLVIRAEFGGADEDLVISGSEDSRVYIWHRHSAALLEVLAGHSAAVNAVAWGPSSAPMLASASDDGTVRVWRAAANAPATLS